MHKNVRVSYPKKIKPVKEEDLVEIKEPERKSMYEVLKDNLKIAQRATFLHRIIYIGEHTFFSFDDARDIFQKIVTKCNETYCIDKLTGFFLFYSSYFLHMVEGDEDNLNKHLGFLLDKSAKHQVFLGNMKLLIHVSHINQRFFDGWFTYTGTPPKLLEKLDVQADMLMSGRHVYNCIKKVYSLMTMYAQEDEGEVDHQMDDITRSSRLQSGSLGMNTKLAEYGILRTDQTESSGKSKSYVSAIMMSSAPHIMASSRIMSFYTTKGSDQDQQTLIKTESKYKIYLPEYELLDFVLKTSFSMKLQDYYNIYGVVPMRDIYKDRVWPVPHDFIPYDVFEKPYDCITEIPKEKNAIKQGVTSASFMDSKSSAANNVTPPVVSQSHLSTISKQSKSSKLSMSFYNAIITGVTDKTYVVKFRDYGNIEEVFKSDCFSAASFQGNPQFMGNQNPYVQSQPFNNGYIGRMEFKRRPNYNNN